MSEETGKTYYSGSDGSVGFGAPADYSGGGVQEGETDKVIDEHNEKAKVRFVRRYQLTKNLSRKDCVGDIYEGLMKKLDGTKLAEHAEAALGQFEDVRTAWTGAQAKLLKQQKAAIEMLELMKKYAEGGQVNLYDIQPGQYKETYQKVEEATQKIIDTYEINGWDLGENFTGFIDSLSKAAMAVEQDSNVNAEQYMSETRDRLYVAMQDLQTVSESGGYAILDELQQSEHAYNDKAKELNNIQEQMSSAWLKESTTAKSESQYMRVLDDTDPTKQESSRVPGYRLAVDSSPRVCGNCRFFKGKADVVGECVAFNSSAKANYVCDAWQGKELTDVHTMMRDEDTKKDADSDWVEPVFASDTINKDGTPKEILGKVPGQRITVEPVAIAESYVREADTFSIPEAPADNAAMRAANGEFLPNDLVYSKALSSLAIVSDSVMVGSTKLYGVNLIHPNGTVYGTGFSNGKDFILRSSKAAKVSGTKSIKDLDTAGVIEQTRNVYRALEAVMSDHQNWVENPLGNKEVLIPLQKQIKAVLEMEEFQNVKTGPKRKYYRALQSAVVSIGAAKLILFESFKAINLLRNAEKSAANSQRIKEVVVSAQTRAYANVDYAFNQVKDSLILPSATHGDEAPGV